MSTGESPRKDAMQAALIIGPAVLQRFGKRTYPERPARIGAYGARYIHRLPTSER
jgi:hypothetical protein